MAFAARSCRTCRWSSPSRRKSCSASASKAAWAEAQRRRNRRTMLKIENLHVEVGGKEILRGLDLLVPAGAVHALMGPNGSGKSTLAYTLAGREGYTITSGRILYRGSDLTALLPEDRAREGVFLAFQYPVEIPG